MADCYSTDGRVRKKTVKPPVHEEEKIPITEKIKSMLSKMFEVEDQPIKMN